MKTLSLWALVCCCLVGLNVQADTNVDDGSERGAKVLGGILNLIGSIHSGREPISARHPGVVERPRPGIPLPNRPLRPGRPGFGGPGHGGPVFGGGRPNIVCQARDRGHEEHWYNPHRSCQECLSKHGSCIETCEAKTTYYVCQVEGRSESGRTEMFRGESPDRFDAQDQADLRCYRSGYRNCQMRGCQTATDSQVVSNRVCR